MGIVLVPQRHAVGTVIRIAGPTEPAHGHLERVRPAVGPQRDDFAVEDDRACLALLRQLLSYMPSNNMEEAPWVATEDPVDRENP